MLKAFGITKSTLAHEKLIFRISNTCFSFDDTKLPELKENVSKGTCGEKKQALKLVECSKRSEARKSTSEREKLLLHTSETCFSLDDKKLPGLKENVSNGARGAKNKC